MHEMSIAMSVIDIASRKAEAGGAVKIESIQLDVGKLAGVLVDSLQFCFSAASKDTRAEDAELLVNELPGKGECKDSGTAFEVDNFITI